MPSSSSSSLQSPSSSPSIGVNVRPFRGGSRINLCLQILDSSSVNRRNSAFTPPVFSFTGNTLIHHYFWVYVLSVCKCPLCRLSPLFNTSCKKPLLYFAINFPHPSGPPWLMISYTPLGDPSPLLVTFIDSLGATVQNAETIIRISSMEKFWFNAFCPLVILVQFSVLYITEYPLLFSASCTFLISFFFCIIPITWSLFIFRLSVSRYQKIMEDLSHTLTTTLNLTEFETQIHAFPNTAEHPEDDTREEPSTFLAVKLLTTRHFNSEAFKQRLCQSGPSVSPSMFWRRSLTFSPWSSNALVIVEGFSLASRGISITNLLLGEVLGRYIEVDTASLKETWGPYLRVPPVWLEFRYENLPDFCHFCGRLSHVVNHCPEFLAKCDSSSAPPPLRYDQFLGAKMRVTSNPFYIANTRTRLRPHIASPSSLAPTPLYRLNKPFIITESSFNESPYDYGMQHLGQPHTTSLGFSMASSSPNIFPQQPHDLNQPTILNPLTSGLNTAITLSSGFHMSLHQHTTTNLNPNHSAPVTTAEQLQASFPKASLTTAATVVATSCDNHHVIPVSQAFSTILADLNPTQPPRFAIGTTSASTPKTNLSRKAKLDRPDCLNAEEFRKMLKRTRNLAKALEDGQVEEAGNFYAEEIKQSAFQLSNDKAPGLDGFNGSFFQRNWHLVGKDVITAAQSFLNGDADLTPINNTLLVLIPKKPNPEEITDYRPISLCSTLYKIISRVLVNRLKPILSRIISPTQSAFLPNRLIFDNIIIGQEVMHSLSHRKTGRLGWMAVKLDMAKAFDRVEWIFIRRVMEKFGFPQKFITLVMACVSTATFSFSINQQVLGHVLPSRGIRQGDPLSPYLFLLCSEGLSSLICLKAQQPQPRKHSLGIKIARTAPPVSHLFFADDSLLLIRFPLTSGLPQTFERTKKDAFNYIKDRVWFHLNKWNSKFFSKGGKEILLKSVVQAIPSYAMACLKLPASFHNKIESMMSQFWWGGSVHTRKIHWKNWSSFCFSKFHGGLGFRSMKAFNQAMLAKQAWRLLQSRHFFVATLLKARYFPNTNFLDSGKGHRPSLVWTSISWGKELLQLGLCRSVGDGTTVSIFNDAWIPGYADVCQAILTIPLTNLNTPDTYYWSLTPHGTYTVNFGYHQAHSILHKNDLTPSNSAIAQTWWKQMWSLPLAPKLKHFLWRACHDILPTSHNLLKRKVLNTTCCCRCFYHDETLEHALFRCATVQEVLQWVENYLDQYQSCNTRGSTPSSTQEIPLLTTVNEPRTPTYRLRLSTNVAQDVRANEMGFGMALQSSQGETLLTLAKPWTRFYQPLLMEAHALQYALSWCHSHSLAPDSIVSDCKVLVNYICNKNTHNIHLNKFVTAINSLLSYFHNAFISYIPRGANEMAHSLAKKALGLDQEALWTSSTLAL
uniref:Reverse transcriptase domain-containing protein n=1 Tax=Cannabis sativa TaxID=3483 RepID=A0A803QM48_CANSA